MFFWIRYATCVSAFALITFSAVGEPSQRVEVSFHRGAGRYAPENTLPAFEKAIQMGADYVEFDVRTSSDGAYFILHDGLLNRTTNGSGPIHKASASDIGMLDAGSWFGKSYAGMKVLTLDETIKTLRGRTKLYVDAKSIPPDALAHALKKFDVMDQAVVYQSPKYLTKLKSINPAIRALCPLHDAKDIPRLHETVQPYAFDTSWDILSKKLIEECHKRNIKVFSDALGKHETIEAYRQAIEWGIDLIQTDYPLRVYRAIESTQKDATVKSYRAHSTRHCEERSDAAISSTGATYRFKWTRR